MEIKAGEAERKDLEGEGQGVGAHRDRAVPGDQSNCKELDGEGEDNLGQEAHPDGEDLLGEGKSHISGKNYIAVPFL